jgi:hypothetical protein
MALYMDIDVVDQGHKSIMQKPAKRCANAE